MPARTRWETSWTSSAGTRSSSRIPRGRGRTRRVSRDTREGSWTRSTCQSPSGTAWAAARAAARGELTRWMSCWRRRRRSGQSAYDPFAASAPASVQPPAQQNYYPPVSNNTGAVVDPFASGVTNPFAQQQQARAPMGSPPMRSVQSPMGAMNVNPLFQQQAQVQQPAQGGMGSLPPVGASSAPYDPFAASPPPQQQRGNNPFAR